MAGIQFNSLSDSEKKQIFEATAAAKGMTPFAVEKDWWVSRTLEMIFTMPASKYLVFKGGTSLSKAWKLISRFSEDIDLVIDKEFLLGPRQYWSKKLIAELCKYSSRYLNDSFIDNLKKEFSQRYFKGLEFNFKSMQHSDPALIEILYPNTINPSVDYLQPRINIEIGCRSLIEPYSIKKINSFVDEYFPGKDFSQLAFEVPVVNPERTFLEKLFLLHEEFQKPIEKIRVSRLSRHLYDVYQLNRFGISEKALADKELYQRIVSHRFQFNRVNQIDYNFHHPRLLDPTPKLIVMDAWRGDYEIMKQEMIYGDEKPTFDNLLMNLSNLRKTLQQLSWEFDLVFPSK